MNDRIRAHAASRAPLALGLVLAGVVATCARPAPPDRSVESVAEMLGRSVEGIVAADDFVWEARRGVLQDLLLGRQVLFLAAPRGGGPRDLHRARARVTRSGRPISVEATHNLTRTPHGDDRELVARGTLVAFATAVGGGIQGVTVLDLSGDAAPSGSWWRRWLDRADRSLRTGSTRGVARTDVAFGVPPSEVRLDIAGGRLVMALGTDAVPAALDAGAAELHTGPRNVYAASATRRAPTRRNAASLAERIAREWIADWAGRAVGGATSRVASIVDSFRMVPRPRPAPAASGAAPLPGAGWPPPFSRGDAAWSPVGADTAPADARLVESVVEDRGEAREWVHVVAMDMRRLSLGWVAGAEEPRSLGGPGGDGRAADRGRIVAAWAGGPRSDDAPGAVFERRVFALPTAGAAAAWADAGGRVHLGAWPERADLAEAVWLRQLGRPRAAGASPAAAAVPLARSAMCRTEAGHLVYAWSPRARVVTLQRALEPLGCSAALLASHPSPVGLALAGPEHDSFRPAAAGMSIDAARLVRDTEHDVFFVTARDPRPAPGWEPDAGVQPPPVSVPAVHVRQVELLGATVRLVSFAPGRFRWLLRAGARELKHRAGGAFPKELPAGAAPVAAIGLAAGRRRAPRGLAIDGTTGLPLRGELGALVVGDGSELAIVAPDGLKAAWGSDATELPLTADDARLLPEGREIGSLRERAAACVLGDGTFVVAHANFDSDEAATEALLDVGCKRVVALDRGDHQAAFVERAGATPNLQEKHDATTLFALPAVMGGSVIE